MNKDELKKALITGFEYGILLSSVLKENDKDVTVDIVTKAEEMLSSEIEVSNLDDININMTPNILSVLPIEEYEKTNKGESN